MARQSANRPTNTDISPYLLDFTGVDFNENKTPQEVPQEEPGFLSKLANSGSAIFEGIAMIPGGIADTVRDAWSGGDIDVTDKAELERRAQRQREKEEYARKYQGKTLEGIPDAMLSLPYSLATMGASLGAGAAAGIAGGPVAAGAAGMAASGTVAYRATKEDFMRRMLGETEKALGRMPTQEEWDRVAAEFDSEATKFGLWEAGPEALSNLFMAKLLGPLGSKVFKGGVGQAAKRSAGLYGEELGTETLSEIGEGKVEAEVGLRDQAPGAWEAFKEIAPATFWQTTLMAGGKKAADIVANRMRRRSEDAANNAVNPDGQTPQGQGGDIPQNQEGSPLLNEKDVQPAAPYAFSQSPENMPVPRNEAPRNIVRERMDELSYADTEAFVKRFEEDEQAREDADFLIEQGRAPSVRWTPRQAALDAGETVDLLQLPQDASGMAQGIRMFGLPEGTGALTMGSNDTGLGTIATPTGYYEPQPIATPYQQKEALPQAAGPSAGQGQWAGGRSQLSYPWPGMAQGIGGLMNMQQPEQATPPSAMPTQSQITNIQVAPRADTTAMTAGLGMSAPEAMPQEAVRAPATDVQMPVKQQAAPAISPLQGIGAVVESASAQPLTEAGDDRGNQGPERLGIPGLQQSDGGRSSQQPIGHATGSAGGRTDESGRPSAGASAGRNQRTIKIPNRDDERVRYEVLEADNVQSSHIPEAGFQPNPRYQIENERRYHDEPASQAKVLNNAQNLDPSFLIESVDANHGAPVIDRQDNVLGGNGRAMSVRMAYEKFPGKAAAYRGALIGQAENLGLDPEQITRMKRPVLVRRVERELGNDERQALVSALNDTFTDSKNARAAGKSRGDRLGRKTLEALARGLADANSLRDYFDQPESAEVVEMLIDDGVIQDTERNALVGKDGLLNPDGKKAVEQALRGRVARSYEALNSLPTPVLGKLDAAIPHMLIAENVGAEWNITEHVRDAIDLLAEFQASDQKAPQTFLAQQDMMKGKSPSERYSQQAQALFLMMLNAKKNAFVEAFAKFAAHAKVSKGGMGIGLSATGAGKKFFGLGKASEGKEESAPSNTDKPKYAPDGTVDKDGVYIKHDGWWYTKGKDGQPKERLAVSFQQRLEDEWQESQKQDQGEGRSVIATNSEQRPAETSPQAAKPNYGTQDNPNTVALAEYFADKLSAGTAYSSIVQARKEAGELMGYRIEPGTIGAKAVDEAIELGAVEAARKTIKDMRAKGARDAEIFRALVSLYQRQPILGTRTSTSVAQQAYSTPTPIAFLASRLASIGKDTTVYEPTAGNGALLIEATPSNVTANELNRRRMRHLRAQGFTVTDHDAVNYLPEHKVDVVIENPPFGRVWNDNHTATQTMNIDGFATKELDQAIVVRSLQALKAKGAGRAVLIIGGKQGGTEARKKGYRSSSQTKFWGWLFNNYHVLEHFSIDGKLYSRQGASFPIDVIVLDTDGTSEGRIFPGAQPPRIFSSFESLEELFNGETMGDAGLRAGGDSGSAAGLEGERGQGRHRPDDHTGVEHSEIAPTDGGRRRDPAGEQAGEAGNGPRGAQGTQRPESRPEHNGTADSQRGQGGHKDSADELQPVRQADDAVARPRVSPEDRGQRAGHVPGESGGLGNERSKLTAKKKPEQKAQKATKFQIPYEKTSTHSSLGTLVPRSMATAIRKSMAALEEAHGNIDDYVASELGYSTEELGKYFAAEQIDAIGLAIHNLSQGAGFIIGDQTGVGKGRVNAAIIRWAKRQGLIPVFVTQKKTLYSDMVRDLADIDMGDFTPLPTDNGLVGKDAIPLPDGRTLKTAQAAKHEQILKEAMQNGLEGYDAVFTTYSQMNANGKRPTPRRDFLSQLAPKAVFILDESHSAGGSASGSSWEAKGKAEPVSKFFRKLLQESPNGVFYSSATYAKSPNVMDLYMKTDMRHAVNDISTLGEAISRGGIPMQQVVAAELAESGQYIRRERTWEGADVETQSVKTAIKRADACADALHCIMLFDRAKQKAVKDANEAAAQSGGLAYDNRAANEDAIKSTNFTSIMHNLIAQSLLAQKVDAIIDQADAALKRGEKPVITLANTMEASISEYAKDNGLSQGDPVGLSFKDLFLRYLHKARQVTKKDNDGNIIESRPLTDAELGSRAVRLFKEAETIINKSGLDDLEVSFIDLIEDGLRKRGYSVGEITGRGTGIDYSGDTPVLYTRKSSNAEKARVIDGFNNGSLDAVIINSSGSTGISLHASERFKDQRRRTMIIAQPDLNIDVFMQTLGRIFRTGQVVPPKYVLLFTDIPAEKRPAAVLAKKMASLNANTTAAKDSDATFKNVPDFLNKYGDRVAMQVVNENEELHDRMGNPLDGMEDTNEGAMKRLTGYIPLLPVEDQARLYDLLESEYNELIAQEEALGTLDLEAKSLPLDAVLEREEEIAGKKDVGPSNSPFTSAAKLGTYNVKRLGRPFPAEKVREMVKAGSAVNIEEQEGRFENWLTERLKPLSPDSRDTFEERSRKTLDSFKELARLYRPGVPLAIENGRDGSRLLGMVTNVYQKGLPDNPLALSTWKVEVAVADASKKLVFPFSQMANSEEAGSAFLPWDVSEDDVYAALDSGQSDSREQVHIATGNILAAYERLGGGKVVQFEDHDGNIIPGIMLPKGTSLNELLNDIDVPLTPAQAMEFLSKLDRGFGAVKTEDKNFVLSRNGEGTYTVAVPAAKAKGAMYYLNGGILKAAGKDFAKAGNSMVLKDLSEQKARAILEVMSSQGFGLVADNNKEIAKEISGLKKEADETGPSNREAQKNDVEDVVRLDYVDGNGKSIVFSVSNQRNGRIFKGYFVRTASYTPQTGTLVQTLFENGWGIASDNSGKARQFATKEEAIAAAEARAQEMRLIRQDNSYASIRPGEFLRWHLPTEGVRAETVRRVVSKLGENAKNAAESRVVQTFDELPENIRRRYASEETALEGVFDPATGQVWFVADNISDAGRAAEVWAHEQIVHNGLRGMLSDTERRGILNRLWLGMGGMGNAHIRQVARTYGLNPRASEADRLTVMEEVVAAMAEKRRLNDLTQQELSLWKRIVRAVARAWGRIIRAVTGGHNSARTMPDVDGLLAALGRYVMDGIPPTYRGAGAADTALASMNPDYEGSAPLASLSLAGIMRVGTKRASTLADAPEIQHLFRKSDLTFLQGIVQLPHWIAKQAKEFASIYDRQLQRMDERSAALKKSLETVPSLFGKSRLSGADLESLKTLLWEIEGRETWQEHVSGVDKFVTKEVLASGRELIEVNPAFYEAFKRALDAADATPRAKEAMLEIRKSLDNDLVLAHNRMASMGEMSDDAIRDFRQSIGHVPNYFPHHRYGAYFVQAKVGSEVVFRQHFDAVGEKAAMAKARKIVMAQRANYPGAKWTDGKNDRLPDEILGAPIDSEAMEQIIRSATSKIGDKERAREISDLLTEGVADVLKSRGWGSHGIRRKGTPGFETDDIARVLYDYKAGLNGWLTKMEAARDFSDALSRIDARKKPNLWKYAAQYTKDMLRNSDRVDRITGNIKAVAFAWYLGGSIKTAVVNATQNLVVGIPRLQMDVSGGALMWLKGAQDAIVDRVTGNKGRGLAEDEARLVAELYGESVITDAFMEEVRGQLSGVTGASLWNKFTKILGLPMSEVERFNRASLALAAYRAARRGNLKEKAKKKYGIEGKATYEQAKDFASEVVRDAHFVYGKSNMPEFMRSNTAGRAMASMYTFRTFSHNMLAMWAWALKTQGREGAAFCAKSIGATMALGGVTALPMYATLMALFQAITGDDDDWTEMIRGCLPQNNLLRDAVCYGAPAMAGVNIGGSLKMETPLTKGLAKGKNPKEVLTDSIGDIIGIPYDLGIVRISNVMDAQASGNYWRMIEEAMPTFVKNGMQAWRLYSEGQTTMRGRPINSPGKPGARKLSGAEAVGKALGFQPVSSTKSYDAYAASKRRDEVRSEKLNELTVLVLKTHDTGDPSGRRQAIKEIGAWNARMKEEGKPQMTITLKDVMRRVKARRRQNRMNGKEREKGARQAETWGI